MTRAENIPPELREIPSWVCWRREQRSGKSTKVPYTPDGNLASVTTPSTWSTFDQVLTSYFNGGGFDGVGLVLTEGGGLFGGDLDHCIDDYGRLETWAAEIVADLSTYTEISPSGHGLRIIGRGKLPPGRRRSGQVEFYDAGRYLTITGNHVPGTPTTVEDRQAEVEALHARLFPQEKAAETSRSPAQPVAIDDAELIRKAQAAANGEVFSRLWAGDTAGYDSPSEADLALCNLLAFWAGGDPERIDCLFRQSGLYRDKWDESHFSDGRTYGRATINKALASASEFYTPRREPVPAPDDQGEPAKRAEAIEPIHMTDVGNGRRLVARHGQDLRYCHVWGHWSVWDGKRWVKDETGEVERRAKETGRAIFDEARDCPDDDRRRELFKHALRSEGKYRVGAMMGMAESERAVVIRPDAFDVDPWLLNVENGTLDLKTGWLFPHRRDRLITKLAPVEYNPDARAPLWEAFLDRILDGNQNLIRFLQRAVGYSLTGSTAEQCFFILWGTGANGKTTFAEAIQALMGDYARQTPVDTLMIKHGGSGIPNDIAALRGARLVTAAEASEGQRLAESLVKQMTGGDRIAARFLHAEWFEFRPEFKIWLATNHKPTVYGTDLAIWRRIRLIPFTMTIPPEEQDRELGQKLEAELPGILAWAVRGCLEWQREELGAPAEVLEATQDYRTECDKLGRFLVECCIFERRAQASASELYLAYVEWCETNGENPVSGTRFGRQLGERGLDKERREQGNVYLGIGLLHDEEEEPVGSV